MQKKRILVVEDNEIQRDILCDILEDAYQVVEAENGKEALDILEQESVSLVLLDIKMPVMDGYTFLKCMRKDNRLVNIPVIVLTMPDSEEDEIKALEHGATDYIPKPYKPAVILRRVAGLIQLQETTARMNEVQYDKLTGLYTKESFYCQVREFLDENPNENYTILCSNLENFKLYNDIFGWKAGDQLLIQVAHTLRDRIGEYGVCCRYSADRFLFLIKSSLEKEGRESFLERRKTRRSEYTDHVTSKIGIYEITDRNLSVQQMCDRAIWAVESIKGLYNHYYAIYNDTVREKMLRENEIVETMVTALKEKQFVLYFQPKYSLDNNYIVGAEALVRWIHPEMGFLTPGEFIPLFEKNGFIHYLDQYVWDCACEFIRKWKDNGYPTLPISVNVSRADFYMTDLVGVFCDLVDKYRIEPALLHLEITESAYISDSSDRIIDTVARLRKHGFVVEMDDFGSGYSSLNMFSQMSADVLKFDMGFVSNELAKPMELSILSDVINMAHRMHLDVVAEGVETGSQMVRLKQVGCDCAQGFYFAKPMPSEEFEKIMIIDQNASSVDTRMNRDEQMDSIWHEMYEAAKTVQNSRKISEYVEAGSVAAAIYSASGRIYTGVCVDAWSSLGVCAERNAMFHMITNGEQAFSRILAILPDGKAVAPCGACRELMVQMMPESYKEIKVLLDYEKERIVPLGDITPEWPVI